MVNDEDAPLWVRIEDCMRMLDTALAEAKVRGMKMVMSEAAYYSTKARRVYELKEGGTPASVIGMVIKGDDQVNAAMVKYHAAQVEYENAREARNVYKKKLDTLREQYSREWAQAKED